MGYLRIVLFVLSSLLIFFSCEISLEPENQNANEQTVFDLTGVDQVEVDPENKHYFNLDKNEYGGFYVDVTNGKKYFISASIESGNADIYFSRNSEIDIESENTSKVDTKGIWISASWSGKLYILVVSKQGGTVVYVDIYTYNPNDVPYGIELTVNDVRTENKLLPANSANYCFFAKGGITYNILGKALDGDIDVFVATRNTVGSDDYDYHDWHGGDPISIIFNTDRYVYILVKDKNTSLGSDYSIRVYSYDEASPNIQNIESLIVNDERYTGYLLPGKMARFYFNNNYGNVYKILGKVSSGDINVYVSNLACVDDQVYEHHDWHGGDWISLLVTDYLSKCYIAVVDNKTSFGSNYSIRVISYDEPCANITTNYLSSGSPDSLVHLNNSEIKRYSIITTPTITYRVFIKDHSGDTDTYISVLSCVDEQVYEFNDWHSDDGIRFLAEANYYYVAVADRGNEFGSDYTISMSIE